MRFPLLSAGSPVLPTLSILSVLFKLAQATTSYEVNGHRYDVDEIIQKDISIVGGGSAGTYSAIRLRDLGKSVAVIEKTGRLGGHTETYIDPVTGTPIDIGVIFFHKFDVVRNYFARLNVAATDVGTFPSGVTKYIDFLTGEEDLTYVPQDFGPALGAYGAQVAKYPYLDLGWNLTYPVPADLLLPFESFVKKYSLDALVPFTYSFTQGIGDLLSKPTIYVMKYIGISSLGDLQNGFLTTAAHDNSLLYASAEKILGADVLYNSRVVDVQRSKTGVLVVLRRGGKTVLIKSKKLIIAVQPTYDTLRCFGLSDKEKSLFKQFTSDEYFTGVLRDTGIPANVSITNVGPGRPYTIPGPPSLYTIQQTPLANLKQVFYLSTTPTQHGEIEQRIISGVKNLQFAGKTAGNPKFVKSSNHRPFELSVSADAIKNGFYRDLYALQGTQSTYYISATFHAHDSSLIWRFAEGLFPSIIA